MPRPAGPRPTPARPRISLKTNPKTNRAARKKTGRRLLIIAVVLLLLVGAGFWYWRSTFSEDTDDAQVDGDIYSVSSRVTGHVTHVYVEDNTQVKQGDLLVEIDPKGFPGRA